MKSIYLLTAFVAATALFFYLAGNFHQTVNLFNAPVIAIPQTNGGQAPVENPAASGTQNSYPPGFIGPTGQPHIIGPKGPPPNY